ncbi:MAG: AbgT family transporter [Bacilli bacterium]
MTKKKKDKKLYGPVFILMSIIIFISILSFIFSIFEIEGYRTVIANGTLVTSLITVKNIISIEGFKFIIGNAVSNFLSFEPLVLLIIALFGIGICERSGFLYAIFSPFKRIKLNIIIFFTLLIGVLSTLLGEYSYIFLIPLIGVIYKYLGKNPILGIIVVFLGITLGYGTGLIFNYNDYLLGNLTQISATLEVDKNYKYSLFSNIYLMWFSTIIFPLIGTLIIDKFLVNKVTRKYAIEEEQLIISKKATEGAIFFGIIYILFVIYLILPINIPFAGILLDNDASRYMEKLLGTSSPFGNGLVIIISLLFVICGYIYGRLSKNIKNGHEFSLGLSKNFENLGFLLVLMFFISQLSAIISWTNIGNVIAVNLIDLLNGMQMSGIILIVIFFILVIIMGILIPGTVEKWELLSPTIIPLFMRANITPGFTQFIFRLADGVSKSLTPVFIYFIIMIGFLEKYNNNEKKQINVFETLKMILPTVIIMAIFWILFICLWYIIGLPIGIGVYSTL